MANMRFAPPEGMLPDFTSNRLPLSPMSDVELSDNLFGAGMIGRRPVFCCKVVGSPPQSRIECVRLSDSGSRQAAINRCHDGGGYLVYDPYNPTRPAELV